MNTLLKPDPNVFLDLDEALEAVLHAPVILLLFSSCRLPGSKNGFDPVEGNY